MPEPVRAKDVQVAHIYQARCRRSRCEWSGDLVGSYAEANDAEHGRALHLAWHRAHPDLRIGVEGVAEPDE